VPSKHITQVTRRRIFDTINLSKVLWEWRLEEPDFSASGTAAPMQKAIVALHPRKSWVDRPFDESAHQQLVHTIGTRRESFRTRTRWRDAAGHSWSSARFMGGDP